MAYSDSANNNGATVMEYTGGSWQPVGNPDFSNGAAYDESLYVYTGTPYVAYEDEAIYQSEAAKVTVMEQKAGSFYKNLLEGPDRAFRHTRCPSEPAICALTKREPPPLPGRPVCFYRERCHDSFFPE